MEHRRAQTITSSPYQYTEYYDGSQDLEPSHGLFGEQLSFYKFGLFSSTPKNTFDYWMLESTPFASPMSTTSLTSFSESVYPPPYTGLPICNAAQSAFRYVEDSPAGQNTWPNESESLCRPIYGEPTACDSQNFVLSYHGGRAYQQRPFTQCMARHRSLQNSHQSIAKFSTAKIEKASNKQDDQSDSETGFFDSDGDCSSDKWPSSTINKFRGKPEGFRLKDFPKILNNMPTTSSHRVNECPLPSKQESQGKCTKQFTERGHLYRHMRTVHSISKYYKCQVPGCNKAFPRSDNLREHYWTHVSHGSRKGKNRKISYNEIREILGSRQEELLQRLKERLDGQMQKK